MSRSIVGSPRYRSQTKRQRHTADDLPFLLVVAERSLLLDAGRFDVSLPGLIALLEQRKAWIRDPKAWKPGTHNAGRQFASLSRHLLARYPAPAFFDEVWFSGPAGRRAWFAHIGQGGNLRTAPALPIPLTKQMAHQVMHAPAGLSLDQAIRHAQAKALGVCDRIARAVLGSRVGYGFSDDPEVEGFWASVLGFFARHPMLDPTQVAPIVDYLYHQKFVSAPAMVVNGTLVQPGPAQPGLSMKDRDPGTLVQQVDAWHRQLARRSRAQDVVWPPCGIAGYERVEGEPGHQRRFRATELLGTAELRGEGAAMHHCVVTYAHSCHGGRCAIYSVTVLDGDGERRMVTVEVDVKNRRIAQIRGRYNALPTPLDQRVVLGWATVAGLTLATYAMGRTA